MRPSCRRLLATAVTPSASQTGPTPYSWVSNATAGPSTGEYLVGLVTSRVAHVLQVAWPDAHLPSRTTFLTPRHRLRAPLRPFKVALLGSSWFLVLWPVNIARIPSSLQCHLRDVPARRRRSHRRSDQDGRVRHGVSAELVLDSLPQLVDVPPAAFLLSGTQPFCPSPGRAATISWR
jgi:hypothetical protein